MGSRATGKVGGKQYELASLLPIQKVRQDKPAQDTICS